MFSIDFTYSAWLLPLCILLAGGLTYWMYRRMADRVANRSMLWLLRGLRFTALLLLLLLLLEPLLTALTTESYPPIVVVLHDNTESLTAHKDSAFVRREFPAKLQATLDRLADEGVSVQTFAIGTDVKPLFGLDKLNYQVAGTDLAGALQTVADDYASQNLSAVILASDGIVTNGLNPVNVVEALRVPVFTILLGDTTPQRDLLIENVLYNDISYLNTETPIGITVKATGMDAATVQVSLAQRGRPIGTQTVNLSKGSPQGNVQFNVPLKEVGIQQFEVHITELDGEISYRNNHQLLFINVLESRVRIALFAGASHPDIGALSKCFATDPRYDFQKFIRRDEGGFYTQPNVNELGSYDLFIFHNFPSTVNDKLLLEKILDESKARKTPIMHFVGLKTRMNISPRQTDYMALTPAVWRETASEAQIEPKAAYLNHVTNRFENDWLGWLAQGPPILRNDGDWKPRAGTDVFATAKIKGIALDYPVFALQENDGFKNMVFVGENLWRYRMYAFTENESFAYFDEWIQNLVQWLTTKEDKRKFRVFPTQTLYNADEPVILKGLAYDATYQPLGDVDIKVVLTDPAGKTFDYFLTEAQTGTYFAEIANLPEGTYSYTAVGTKKGVQVGTDAGQFSVGRSAIEFLNLQADANTLRQLALRTKGTFVAGRQVETVADDILKLDTLSPLLDYKRTTMALHRFWWPLLLALGLLAIEWVIRKRNGLI